ncbi:MAG: class I SAM-dependent methyltransferase [Chloroflexi bacterium]|nr:class I SAM-dependent methyltransferase [Chloroflexota bacterium]
MSLQNNESNRIRQVYRGYHTDLSKQSQWSLANPGNQAIWKERQVAIYRMLLQNQFLPLENKRILEIGCGNGRVLADFLQWGAKAENLYGVDLLNDRIESARQQYSDFHFECTNAETLNFSDGKFDLVLFFTVFSSILDANMQKHVAAEALRVLKKGGAILWYDFRYYNPSNSHVRGMTKADIQRLFPTLHLSLRTITFLPPLARKLGIFTSSLYPLLSKVPFLRTHYLAFLLIA